MKIKPSIYILSGKNPLQAKSGYASYTYNLSKILTNLGYKVMVFCFGKSDQVIKSKIGTIHIIGSNIFSLLKDVEMAGLILLTPRLSIVLAKQLKNTPGLIWGIGPWGLAGALAKLFSRGYQGTSWKLVSDYFTTTRHEFLGTLAGVTVKDHGLVTKFNVWFAYVTLVQLYNFLERFLLHQSHKIITHYQSTENILTSQFGLNSKQFIRLPYFVQLRNRPHNTSDSMTKSPLIICVSRHDGRKGINFLLKAFAILNERGAKYYAFIIGAGRLRQKHLELAQSLHLSNVYQPGFVPDLKYYLKRTDVFVLPSLEEGSSALAILEAAKQGLPIISTNIDGIKEDFIHDKSALLIPPKNPKALAEAIQSLLKDKRLAKRLGQNAKKTYFLKHNESIVKREVAKFLHGF